MSAENDDDVKVPTRRRRASDDEAEEADFQDAAEYAASVAESQAAVDQEDRGADEPRSDGGDDEDHGPVGKATGEEEVTETEEAPGDQEQADELAGDRKKAKLREPFEVPTSGAFWLHDDRFGGEEPQAAEPSRTTGGAGERKARSDTEGRWLHDKFSALESGAAADDDSDNAFSYNRRGRGGRGMRGGRRGGRGGDGLGGRGPSISAGRGRDGRYDAGSADGSAEAPPGLGESQEALPQRQPRAPRASTRSSGGFQGAHEDDAGAASGAAAGYAYFGAGRGRGQSFRGGRSGEFSGRDRSERSFSPEGGNREDGSGAEYGGPGGRGRGAAGRGRGRDDAAPGRGGYANGGRGAGRGYGRGPDAYDREAGAPAPYSSNGGDYDGGRGRGRGAGRSGDFQGRGSGPGGRGPPGGGRGMAQRQPPPPHQQQRRSERTIDEEFPPLPGRSSAFQPLVTLTLSAEEPLRQQDGGSVADTGAPLMQGVRRYSKMAGKVVGGAAGGDAGGSAPAGSEAGRSRAGAGEGGGGGARASKLSAAAPTFEPSPATTGRQQQAPPPQPQQPVPSVPVAFGAPLQPMTVVTITQNQPPPPPPQQQLPPAQPMGGTPEPYSAGPPPPPHGQQMAYVPQQQQPPPQSAQGGQAQGYMPLPQQAGMPPPQQQSQQSLPPPQQQPPMMGSPMAPQGMLQQQYGAIGGGGMYGTSIADMEAWYQDAYQKARATGMDPQQAYSAVQGYVQGMQMAFQHFNMQTHAQASQQQQQQQQQQWAGYPGVPPMMQGPPPAPAP